MKLHFNHWLFNFWPLSNFEAITLPWGIYFKELPKDTDTTIIQHELIHLEQRARIGPFKFYVLYLFEYARNLLKFKSFMKAYEEISFEKEAYRREAETISLDSILTEKDQKS